MAKLCSSLLNPLFWKPMVTLMGMGFAVVNLTVDTSTFFHLPDQPNDFHGSGIKAAGFAIITAIALFAGSLPTGNGRLDKLADASSRMLGILATLRAGWFWLHGETHGNLGACVYSVWILTVIVFNTVLIWGGIFALFALTLK